MIKVDVVQNKGFKTLYFEQRDTSQGGLEQLDDVYCALLGSEPKQGGYISSNKFSIDIRDTD